MQQLHGLFATAEFIVRFRFNGHWSWRATCRCVTIDLSVDLHDIVASLLFLECISYALSNDLWLWHFDLWGHGDASVHCRL